MTAVFVHGVPEVAAIWGPLVDALSARGVHDVVLLSPPGFGAPVPPAWEPSADAYRAWLTDELGRIGGDIDLVGHDWGAGHVFGAVAERPGLVRSWAADCAGLVHPDYVWHDAAQTWQTPGAGEEMIEVMVGMPLADRQGLFAAMGAPDSTALAMAEGLDADMGRCILGLYRSAIQPSAADIGRRLVAADRPPGLVIVAGDDPYVSAEHSRQFADALGAEQVVLDGCGHWWMFQEPETAADALVGFWSRLA